MSPTPVRIGGKREQHIKTRASKREKEKRDKNFKDLQNEVQTQSCRKLDNTET